MDAIIWTLFALPAIALLAFALVGLRWGVELGFYSVAWTPLAGFVAIYFLQDRMSYPGVFAIIGVVASSGVLLVLGIGLALRFRSAGSAHRAVFPVAMFFAATPALYALLHTAVTMVCR
jgi:hypothetical protein